MNYDPRTETRRRWAVRVMGLLATYQIAVGTWFIALRPPLLPEDLRYMKLATVPDAMHPWLHLVFAVLGGQMVAGGLLLVPFIHAVRSRNMGPLAWACLMGAGVMSAGLMGAVNFLLSSDFRWVLLAPAAAWVLAVVLLRPRSAGR